MLITEKNREKIEGMIKEAEGRAKVRKLNYEDIIKAISYVEKTLGVPKKYLENVYVYADVNAQDFPSAYGFTPESTHFSMVRKKSGWNLTCVQRERTRRGSQRYIIKLTDDAKDAIIKRMSCF